MMTGHWVVIKPVETCPKCGTPLERFDNEVYQLGERCPAGCYWTDFRNGRVKTHSGPSPETLDRQGGK